MRSLPFLRSGLLSLLVIVTLFGSVSHVLAGTPQLDKGVQTDVAKLYDKVNALSGTVFEDRGIYGKLDGETPIDVYSFVPDQDGEQSISLMVREDEVKPSTDPYLILVDPTSNTQAEQLQIPLPSQDYHTTVVKQIPLTQNQMYTEPVLMEQYRVAAEDRITFNKDKTYYLIVLDSDRSGQHINHYAITFGTGKAWTAKDLFTHFGQWFRLKTDTYGSVTPFSFGPAAVGYLIFLLGLVLLAGAWIIRQIFNLLSNRSSASAFLFVKLQVPFNIVTWVGLWFVALGGYMYFARHSWSGLPFLIAAVYIPVLVVTLVDTLILSSKVKQVEVSRKEANIPLALRKQLFATFVLGTLSLIGLIVLVTMQVVA
jgi:hypothetical protein